MSLTESQLQAITHCWQAMSDSLREYVALTVERRRHFDVVRIEAMTASLKELEEAFPHLLDGEAG